MRPHDVSILEGDIGVVPRGRLLIPSVDELQPLLWWQIAIGEAGSSGYLSWPRRLLNHGVLPVGAGWLSQALLSWGERVHAKGTFILLVRNCPEVPARELVKIRGSEGFIISM